MNIIRQREKLKELYEKKIIERDHFFAALNCPVFEWSPETAKELTEEDADFINNEICSHDSHMPNVAPFQCFRISMKRCFDQWFYYEDAMMWHVLRVAYEDPETGPEQWYMNDYSVNAGGKCFYRIWRGGKCVTEWITNPNGTPKQEAAEIMRSLPRTLTYFLFEVMHPKSCVLKVSPPAEQASGRSIEWRLAREHYLIVSRDHAAASRDSKKPIAQSDAVIKRGAHWRIAHPRRLMSEKFKHKRGQVIYIREQWVGPKEWIGLDKKIYKVVDIKISD